MPKMPKRVTVERVENGFIVRGSDEKGNEKQMICKDMSEVHKVVSEMMGEKTKEMKKKGMS